MRKGGYKKYLDPHSNDPVPRTTCYRSRMAQEIQNDEQNRSSLSSSTTSNSSSLSFLNSENTENNFVQIDDFDHRNEAIERDRINQSALNWLQLDSMFDENNADENNETDELLETWFDAEDILYTPLADSTASNSDVSQNEYIFRLGEKLCECTSTSRGEAVMMVLTLGAKHCLTWEVIIDFLLLINALFGDEVVPATKYKLFKYFPFEENLITYHLFCSSCKWYLQKRSDLNITELVCVNCDKVIRKAEFSFFISLDFHSQLKQLLEDSEVQSALNVVINHIGEQRESLEDIYDGSVYKKLQAENEPLASKYNLSYTFSTDGCQTSKSSRISAWPIYAMIHQLPPKLREKHIIMTSLWVSDIEPDMNLFLEKFVEEANTLSSEGIEWKLGTQCIRSKVLPLCGCFDSVARCKVLNMKQYNGYYGCTFCEHKGVSIDRQIKFPVSTDIPLQRTDESIKAIMVEMEENHLERSEKGVKGPSVLMNLQYFDLVNGMIPDYMHAILLGVIKQYTEILLTSVNTEYYIGLPTNLLEINNRLLSIKHPSCITRSPRKIEERNIWKASEWRSWLIFYAIICLDGILPRKYLKHLGLLVSAVELLLSNCLTNEMIEEADNSLIEFVALYQEYFGEVAMTYNIHLLLHMRRSALNWGPLWTHNAFCFENENKSILQLKKSPAHITLQIMKKYLFFKSLKIFIKKFPTGENFERFHERALRGRLKNALEINNCTLIGNGKEYYLNDEERQLIDFSGCCKVFNRLIINGMRYTSESYRQCLKINDSVIETICGKKGIITNICVFPNGTNEEIVIFYREIILSSTRLFPSTDVTITHIKQCVVSNVIKYCNPNSLLKQGFLVRISNNTYFISIPRGCYGD